MTSSSKTASHASQQHDSSEDITMIAIVADEHENNQEKQEEKQRSDVHAPTSCLATTTTALPSETPLTAAQTSILPTIQTDHDLRVPYYCEENIWRITYRKLYFSNMMRNRGSTGSINNEEKYVVAFISNPNKCIPMYFQRAAAATNEKQPCCWDYHVILLGVKSRPKSSLNYGFDKTGNDVAVVVYDVDTTLTPYPLSLQEYVSSSFLPKQHHAYDEYQPYFRILSAETYLKYFSSNRSHMYNKQTQSYNEPPPSYQCINPNNMCNINDDIDVNNSFMNESSCNNLHQYLNFSIEQVRLGSTNFAIDSYDNVTNSDKKFGTVVTLEQLLSLQR